MQYMKLAESQRLELMASLAGMTRFLREAFASLTPEEARSPGPCGAFSPVEQACHLADLEREGFGLRISRLRTETHPHLPNFDGDRIAKERDYRGRSLAEGLATFAAAREANLRTLQRLTAEDWLRRGTQEGVGEVSICDMPAFLRQHDEAHVAEIREWRRFAGRAAL